MKAQCLLNKRLCIISMTTIVFYFDYRKLLPEGHNCKFTFFASAGTLAVFSSRRGMPNNDPFLPEPKQLHVRLDSPNPGRWVLV